MALTEKDKKKKEKQNGGSVKSTTVQSNKAATSQQPQAQSIPVLMNNYGKSVPYAIGYKPIPSLKDITKINGFDRNIHAIRDYQDARNLKRATANNREEVQKATDITFDNGGVGSIPFPNSKFDTTFSRSNVANNSEPATEESTNNTFWDFKHRNSEVPKSDTKKESSDILGAFASFKSGLNNGLSFGLADKIDEYYAKKLGLTKDQYSELMSKTSGANPYYAEKSAAEDAKKEHSTANTVGNIGGKIIGSGLVGGAVSKGVEGALSSKLGANGLSALQKYGIGVGADLTGDVVTDTIPQVIRDKQDGKTTEEIAKDAGKNVAANLGINLVGNGLVQGIPQLLSKGKKGADSAQDAVESAVKNDSIQKNAVSDIEFDKINPLEYGTNNKKKSNITSEYINKFSFENGTPEVTGNYKQIEYGGTPKVIDSESKNNLDAVAAKMKKNMEKAVKLYSGNTDNALLDEAKAAMDNYVSNPTDDMFMELSHKVSALNNSLQGTSYKNPKWKTTMKYNNDVNDWFNHKVDELALFAESAYKTNGEPAFNIVDDISASKPQQDLYRLERPNKSGYSAENVGNQPKQDLYRLKRPQESAGYSVENVGNTNATYTEPLQRGINQNAQGTTAGGETAYSRYSNQSVPNKSDLPDNVKQVFVDEPQVYSVLKNADTQKKADDILASYSGNTSGAVSECRRLLDAKDPSSIPLGYSLSKQLIDEGNTDAAVDLIRDMSASLTKSGQFTQSAAMTLLHDDPQAALRYAVKEVDSINTAGQKKFGNKWTDISITDDEINMLNSAKKGDTEAIKAAYDQIGDRIAKEYPSTKWEKFVELTKLGMLFNPRTHIRNVVANALLSPIRSLSDRVSAVGMNVAHIINPDIKVTQSLTGSVGGKYKKAASDVWDTVKEGITGSNNKWDDLSGSVFRKQVFKDSKIGTATKEGTVSLLNHIGGEKLQKLADWMDDSLTGSFTENLRNFDYYLLSAVEDDTFVKKNFVNRLASYMKAQNITDVEKVPDDAIALATSEALKATFKDDNMLSKMLSNFKKYTGKFGEVLLPFTKTPANLAMRSIDYSPVGIISTVNQIRKKADVNTVMDSLSKNLVGTAGIVAGYILAKNGIIRGALSDDKDEAAFQKQQGILPYSINVHGNSYTYDWAQPASVPLIMGTVIYQAIEESDAEERSILSKVADTSLQAGKAVANQWFEQSPLQSLSDIFGGNGYGENDIAGNIGQEILEMPQRLIPSLMSATANVFDTSLRTSFSNGDSIKTYADTVKSKIPGARETLPQAYDTWGNPKMNADSTEQAAFNNYINPGKNGRDAKTDIDDTIQALYDSTGDAAVFPQQMSWSVKIGDTSKKLNNVEYSDYQKNVGETSYQFARAYLSSDACNNSEDATKAENLNTLYNLSKAIYEQEAFGKNMSESNAKYYAHYQSGGIDELMEFIDYKNTLSSQGLSDNDKMIEIWNRSGTAGIQQYAEKKSAYESCGIDYDSNSKGNVVYEERGVSGLDMWNKIRSASLKTNDSGSKSVDNELLYKAVSKANISDEDKGYYIMNIVPKSDKLNKIYADNGYESVYRYFLYKYSSDYDGNGSLKKDEITTFLNQQDMTNEERNYWFDIMKTGNTKNPYQR